MNQNTSAFLLGFPLKDRRLRLQHVASICEHNASIGSVGALQAGAVLPSAVGFFENGAQVARVSKEGRHNMSQKSDMGFGMSKGSGGNSLSSILINTAGLGSPVIEKVATHVTIWFNSV